MQKDTIELIKKLLEIYEEEGEYNEGSLTDHDVIFMIELIIKISHIRGGL